MTTMGHAAASKKPLSYLDFACFNMADDEPTTAQSPTPQTLERPGFAATRTDPHGRRDL